MAFTRLLTTAALCACLALPASAAANEFGGAAADPVAVEASGGGIVAPAGEPEAAAEAAQVEAPEAAQEDTPTTPEGEEQPPEEQPDGEQPPTEVDGDETETGTGVGGTGGETADGLPRTGMELLALTMIGLGLLLAGGALWPTRSWPPPRDRLSRSSLRR
jgi:hypothetical protein